jgi:protein phosphatase
VYGASEWNGIGDASASGDRAMSVASRTDRGMRRENNEDALLVAEVPRGLLLAVADGVGGGPAGEVASTEAVRLFEEAMRRLDGDPALPDPASALARAAEDANSALWQRSVADEEVRGMGTTLVAALVDGTAAWIVNVGDSRAYLVRYGVARQITEDHNLAAERVSSGELTEEEALEGGLGYVITRCLAMDETVEPEIFGPIQVSDDATLLLCSDGLSDVLTAEEIGRAASIADADDAAASLVARANAAGGPDNITVVLYRPG